MKNIHVIPTDKPSRLGYLTKKGKEVYKDLRLFDIPISTILDGENQNIYITSDEELKYLDYYIAKIKDSNGERYIVGQRLDNDSEYSNCKKIILTTDQSLIEDGIQVIDDEFLEWFVKNPSCEYVETKISRYRHYYKTGEIMSSLSPIPDFSARNMQCEKVKPIYEIIIPKEELEQKYYFYEELEKYANKTSREKILADWEKSAHLDDIGPTVDEFKTVLFKVIKNFCIEEKTVLDMCIKEQENIILFYRLDKFIEMINSLPDDTEKNRILKSVFNNEPGNLLLESYKKMKSFYEK